MCLLKVGVKHQSGLRPGEKPNRATIFANPSPPFKGMGISGSRVREGAKKQTIHSVAQRKRESDTLHLDLQRSGHRVHKKESYASDQTRCSKMTLTGWQVLGHQLGHQWGGGGGTPGSAGRTYSFCWPRVHLSGDVAGVWMNRLCT